MQAYLAMEALLQEITCNSKENQDSLIFLDFKYLLLLFSVNIKPPRHRFGLCLAWGWQYLFEQLNTWFGH